MMNAIKTYTWNNRLATVTETKDGFEVYCARIDKTGDTAPSRRFNGTCCKTFKHIKKAMGEVHAFLNGE